MSVSSGTISPPVSISDVKTVLNNDVSNDLGTLCTSNSIARRAMFKPFVSSKIYEPPISFNYANMTYYHLDNCLTGDTTHDDKLLLYYPSAGERLYNICGINYPACSNGGYNLLETLVKSLDGFNTTTNHFAYEKPRGGVNSPYRLTDFAYYNKALNCDFQCTWKIGTTTVSTPYTNLNSLLTLSNGYYPDATSFHSAIGFPARNTFGDNNPGTEGVSVTITQQSNDGALPLAPIIRQMLGVSESTRIYAIASVYNLDTVSNLGSYDGITVETKKQEIQSNDTSVTISNIISNINSNVESTNYVYVAGVGTLDTSTNRTEEHFLPIRTAFCIHRVWQIPSDLIHTTDVLIPKLDPWYNGSASTPSTTNGTVMGNYRHVAWGQTDIPIFSCREIYLIVNFHSGVTTTGEYNTGPFSFYIPITTNNSWEGTASAFSRLEDNFFLYLNVVVGNTNYVSKGVMCSMENIGNTTVTGNIPDYNNGNTQSRIFCRGSDLQKFYQNYPFDTNFPLQSMSCCKINGNKITVCYRFNLSFISGDVNPTLIGIVACPGLIKNGSSNVTFSSSINSSTYSSPTTNQAHTDGNLNWYTDSPGN